MDFKETQLSLYRGSRLAPYNNPHRRLFLESGTNRPTAHLSLDASLPVRDARKAGVDRKPWQQTQIGFGLTSVYASFHTHLSISISISLSRERWIDC